MSSVPRLPEIAQVRLENAVKYMTDIKENGPSTIIMLFYIYIVKYVMYISSSEPRDSHVLHIEYSTIRRLEVSIPGGHSSYSPS